MRIPRVYHPGPLHAGATVSLGSTASGHLVRVLRLRPGAPLVVFNGDGGEFPADLVRISKTAAEIRLGERVARDTESPFAITLVQGISRGERMEYTIQKAVEIGVTRIVPVEMARTVVSLRGEKRQRRCERWQSVAISACEQSGRNRVPEVAPPQLFDAWLAHPLAGSGLMLDHRADEGIASLQLDAPVTLLVGPEGGLTEEERARAKKSGYRAVRLGPRVLRTETAGIAALAVLQAKFGDLG